MSESWYDAAAQAALADFDRQYTAQESQFHPGPEILPDGLHTVEILSASLKKSPKAGTPIFALVLRVVGGPLAGAVLERGSVLTSQQNIDRLGGDLVALGLDADQWTAARGRPFSRELVANMGRLPGKRFVAQKKTNPSDDPSKPYHNLYVNSLVSSSPMPTTPAGFAPLPAREREISRQNQQGEIPF